MHDTSNTAALVTIYGSNGPTLQVDRSILDAARMATFDRLPSTDQAKAFIEALAALTEAHEAAASPRQRQRNSRALERFREAVGAFAADLVWHAANDDAEGFMYRSADREELAETLVSTNHFEQLVQWWRDMGLMEMSRSIDVRTDFDGEKVPLFRRARRFRGTRQFLELANAYELQPNEAREHFSASDRVANVVQVRASKGSTQHRTDSAKLLRKHGADHAHEVDRLRRLNAFLKGHGYSLSDTPRLRRIFSCGDHPEFAYDKGGRFYCASDDNWMEMKKEDRARILIDGEETTEIDVRASHLSILYALCGARMSTNDDPYALPGIEREVVKKVIVAAFGGGQLPTRWPRKFNQEYEEEHGYQPRHRHKLKDVVAAIKQKHPILKRLRPGQLDWATLQYEEAECFLAAMMTLHERHGVATLPVHDSLIVPRSNAALARQELCSAYRNRLGFDPWLTESRKPNIVAE